MNNQHNLENAGSNEPHGGKPKHLGDLLNQGGKARGAGQNQAMSLCLPELMNQGGSTEHKGDHMEWKTGGKHLGKMMGQ